MMILNFKSSIYIKYCYKTIRYIIFIKYFLSKHVFINCRFNHFQVG